MRRVVSCLVAALVVVLTSSSSSLALKVPATDEKIVLTTASGEERIVTRAEMEEMERQQRELHAQLLKRVEGDWVEDQSLADVKQRDPSLARSIVVARESFDVLQRHGYARGYKLAGFTELDAMSITSKQAQKDPGFNGKIELRITLQLRAERDPNAREPANPGTSAAKRGAEPETLAYEVEVLYDKNEVASVVFAWQLTRDDRRGKELRITPSEALRKRYEERQRAAGSAYATWLLAGGVVLVVAGGAVLLLTPRPPVKAKNEPPANATSPKKATTKRKDAAAGVIAREAGDGWELANGK